MIPLILLAATTAHADSLLDQGMNLVEQGQAFLRGNDGVTLRKAWSRGDANAYTVISDRAIHGNDIAQNLMGVIFDIGKFGQNKNSAKALEWFNKSALNNNFVAFYNLGIVYSNGRIPGLRPDRIERPRRSRRFTKPSAAKPFHKSSSGWPFSHKTTFIRFW